MTKKAKYGSVKVVNRNGKLYLDFRYLGDRFRPSLNLVANATNEIVAKQIASKIELDIATGQFDTTLVVYLGEKVDKTKPRDTHRSDLSSLFRYYWDLKGLNGSDYESVRRFIYRGNPNWGNLEATVKAQGWSTTTHNRYCKILNQFLQWAISEENIPTKLLPLLKGTKKTHETRKPFTLAEMQTICTAFKDYYHNKGNGYGGTDNYYYLVLFLFATGCRMGEIVGLKAKHFNLANKTVEIAESLSPKSNYESTRVQKPTKTGSVRVLPLPKFLVEIFTRILDGKKPDAYIFVGPEGEPINQRNFTQRIWKGILGKLELDYRVPYAGRHTMASMAIEQGIPLTGIAYLMGHSDTTMVMKQYGHMINKPNLPTIDLGA